MSSDNNNRIAKNTLALYFRTFITLIVGLYTNRVMLDALGVSDFGINSVVGGIVGMSTMMTGAMSGGISRFITHALGKGDKKRLSDTFSTSVNAQFVMSAIVVVVLEIAGTWFLNNKANIPDGRLFAANCVLQCAIITLVTKLVSVPYNATIIAHERMKVFAYASIAEALANLAVCFAILYYGGERLILLAILHVVVAIALRLFYGCYCQRCFDEAKYDYRIFDRNLLKEITKFSGWNLLNNGAWVFSTQGVSMLVNVFFGVTYNASRQVATTVNGAVQHFVTNFTTAFTPQVTKQYAAGNVMQAISLTNRGTRFSWLLMYIFIVPICMEADTLLGLWLVEVPPMAALFLRLTMFESLAVSSGQTLMRLIQADGNMTLYSILTGLYVGLVFPLSWLLFYLGAPVWSTYIVFVVVFFSINAIRFYCLKRLMPFSARQHIRECVIPCLIVSIVSFVVPVIVSCYMEQGIMRFFILSVISVLWTLLCCYVFGVTKRERSVINGKIIELLIKVKGKI